MRPGSRAVAAVVLSIVAATATAARQPQVAPQPQLEEPRRAEQPQPTPQAQAPAGKELVTLQADTQQMIGNTLWCGLGNVHITYQDISVRCDEIQFDQQTMEVEARGNVLFDQGATRMSCDRLKFDLRKKTGTMWNVAGFFPPTYNLRAEELEKLDATHWHFLKGVFTSCELGTGSPPWSLEVKEATIEIEGYGHFRGVALKAKGVPVFYTPRLLWPVKRDRAAGLLVPTIGYNNRQGAYLGNAVYWPVSRSLDTTFFLDTYSTGYLGLGDELRWAPAQDAKGQVLFRSIYDPDSKQWEWKVQGRHTQLFPGGYSLKAQLLDLSNLDFFQQFERTFDQNALRTLYSYVTLSRAWGPQAYNITVDQNKTFFPSGNTTSEVILDRLPEAEYRLRSTRIGESPVYLSMVGVADQLRMNRSATLKGTYGRFDLFPTVSILTSGLPWLNVTPSVGARETYYTSSYSTNRQALVSDPLSRSYVTAGVDLVGPSFSRVWTKANGDKVKHLIEPRLEYAYVSDPGDQSRIPIFDQRDSVLVTNSVTATLSNALFYKSGEAGSRQVATFEISQRYSFSDLFPATGLGVPPSRRGPVSLWLHLAPDATTGADVRAAFDAVTHKLSSTSLNGGFSRPGGAINLTWYSSYDPASGEVTSSQARLYGAVAPVKGPWRFETGVAYDIHTKKLLEQRAILRWRGSCWSAYVEVRDYRIDPYRTKDYRIAIDLTGLGTFLDIRGAIDSLAR